MARFAPSSHPAIEDYAFISNCTTAALISRAGSIDWLSWPRFDSSAGFAALLGSTENGRWHIAPKQAATVSRGYFEGTLILATCCEVSEGIAELIDFMPLESGCCEIVRLIRGISGSVLMRSQLALRFEYGSAVPWVEAREDGRSRES